MGMGGMMRWRIAMEVLEDERQDLVHLLQESVEKSIRKFEQRRKKRLAHSKPPELWRSIKGDHPALVQSYEENKVIWM